MTRRQLGLFVVAIITLGIVLGVGAGRYADAETRRTYLLIVVVLYTLALVVWILAVMLVRLSPHVEGLLERYMKQEAAPLYIPDEVRSLMQAVRNGRRSAHGFDTWLRHRLDALVAEESGGSQADLMPDEPTATHGRGVKGLRMSARVPLLKTIAARLRRGPSIKELEAMLDSIEED